MLIAAASSIGGRVALAAPKPATQAVRLGFRGHAVHQLLACARIVRPGALGPYARIHWKPALAGGLMCALAYGLVIWALTLGAMAYVSALRETSVIFAVLIGWILLGEPFGRRRIVAAILVGFGIAIMHLAG